MPALKGTFTVMVTPFSEDGRHVDEDAIRRFVEWQIQHGVHGLIPVASTGEFLSLTDAERRRVAEIVIEQVNGRIPVLVGAGAENTWDVVRYSREAEDLGADGVLIIPPFYSTPTEDELYERLDSGRLQPDARRVLRSLSTLCRAKRRRRGIGAV